MDMGYFRSRQALYPFNAYVEPKLNAYVEPKPKQTTTPATTKRKRLSLWPILMLTLFLTGLLARLTHNPSRPADDSSLLTTISRALLGEKSDA